MISPNKGALAGQNLIISGSGFSKDISKVSVSVDGVNCAITSSSLNQINCRLAAKQLTDSASLSTNIANPVNTYVAGTGFQYTKYDLSRLSARNIQGFKAAVLANSS
jgi:hypothetical protein